MISMTWVFLVASRSQTTRFDCQCSRQSSHPNCTGHPVETIACRAVEMTSNYCELQMRNENDVHNWILGENVSWRSQFWREITDVIIFVKNFLHMQPYKYDIVVILVFFSELFDEYPIRGSVRKVFFHFLCRNRLYSEYKKKSFCTM